MKDKTYGILCTVVHIYSTYNVSVRPGFQKQITPYPT